jgi:methylmalonyl-CoA mutase cobalamin-binding subunit
MLEFLSDHRPIEFFEDVLIPALRRVDADRREGQITAEHAGEAEALIGTLIDEVPAPPPRPATFADSPSILGFPARDEADWLCGRMLARVMAETGLELELSGPGHLSSELAELAAERKPDVIVVSALGRSREANLRHILRRIAARDLNVMLVAAVWEGDSDESDFHPHLRATAEAVVVTTLADAADAVRIAASRSAEPPRTVASNLLPTRAETAVKHTSPTFQ